MVPKTEPSQNEKTFGRLAPLSDVAELEDLSIAPENLFTESMMLRCGKARVVADHFGGIGARFGKDRPVTQDVGNMEVTQTVLFGSEQVARPTHFKIFFCQEKTVGRAREDVQALLRIVSRVGSSPGP